MNIEAESLEPRHLPILRNWTGRTAGAPTPNDFPQNAAEVAQWFELLAAESGRMDCLVSVYDTPVGIAGLRRNTKAADSAELYLLLCEVGYNLLRTATYATLCMLDRAFQECELRCVAADVNTEQREYLAALERMGFCRIRESRRTITVEVQKEMYLNNRFLF